MAQKASASATNASVYSRFIVIVPSVPFKQTKNVSNGLPGSLENGSEIFPGDFNKLSSFNKTVILAKRGQQRFLTKFAVRDFFF